ncbi:MAG: hypothetical protein DHS20C15_19950 [Planctomycetota bacterium]|nr:MAG: hypothetical protein DHS20C15_19950 [Planctomycetota bacterium]
MPRHSTHDHATRRARRLGDVHEAIDQLLHAVATRPDAADLERWTLDRRRLERLVQLSRRMIFALRDQQRMAPLPAVLDPLSESFLLEFHAQLRSAGSLVRRGSEWPAVVAELTEFLAWSFIGVEESLDAR